MGLGLGIGMAGQMLRAFGQGGVPGFSATPPPPPAAAAWHVTVSGQTLGPMSIEQLTLAAQQGQIGPSTLVWTAGMTGWTAAGQVPQLAQLFGPPPPPPMGVGSS
jgi:hypothetical protein